MSKSQVDEILHIALCVLKDAEAAFPHLAMEVSRDAARLREIAECRGLVGFCIDLPALGKHLDRCLSSGHYTASGLPYGRLVSKRVLIPQFLRGLYLMVYDSAGHLKEQPDVEAIYFLRQIYYLAKKVELPCPDSATLQEIEAFVETDLSLPEPESSVWESEDDCRDQVGIVYKGFVEDAYWSGRFPGETGLLLRRYLDYVFGTIVSTLGPYDPYEWRCKHGPGAIAQVERRTNKYHWYSWPERLDSRFPFSDFGCYNLGHWARTAERQSVELSEEESSRLIAVRKTLKSPRLIAAEPSSHQFCQQNVWHYLGDQVSATWLTDFLDFRSQERNQIMALNGSKDGSLATLDLSSASDRVSCKVVGTSFRSNPVLVSALASCRTRFIRVRHPLLREFTHKLKKFSTMGSACTFPVESLIFFGISLAAVMFYHRMPMNPGAIRSLAGKLSVFGDDIIVPVETREVVQATLESCDFKVNTDKSFSEGNFRESCGVDAFRGVNVSPVYLRRLSDRSVESVVSRVDTANHFYSKWLLHAADAIARTLGDIPHVHASSTHFGLHDRSLTVFGQRSFQRRWNQGLQHVEIRVPVPRAVTKRVKPDGDSLLHQYFTERRDRPIGLSPWEGGAIESVRLKLRRTWVPEQLLLKE